MKGNNTLFVFEDSQLHQFKEQSLFTKAHQPFGPVNVFNEIMEMSGNFKDRTVTSIVSFDTDQSSLMYQMDEKLIENNIDSIADHIVNFNCEDCKLTQNHLP